MVHGTKLILLSLPFLQGVPVTKPEEKAKEAPAAEPPKPASCARPATRSQAMRCAVCRDPQRSSRDMVEHPAFQGVNLCRPCGENALLTAEWENDAVWRKPDGCNDAFCRVCLREGEPSDARCPCGTLVCDACLQAHFPEETSATGKGGCLRCRKFCPRRKQGALPSRKAAAAAAAVASSASKPPMREVPAKEEACGPAAVGGDTPAAVWVLGGANKKRGMSGVLAAITNNGRTGLTPAKGAAPGAGKRESGENAAPRALNL